MGDERVRFRKVCDCPSGAATRATNSYVHHVKVGSEVSLPADNQPVCLVCRQEWRRIECSGEERR